MFRWIVGQGRGPTLALGWPEQVRASTSTGGGLMVEYQLGAERTAAGDCGVALAGDERPATER